MLAQLRVCPALPKDPSSVLSTAHSVSSRPPVTHTPETLLLSPSLLSTTLMSTHGVRMGHNLK